MDEATASLDNASQALIQRFIETELRGKSTVVAVIHRLDVLPSYDKILVMKSGRVVESGNYEELMKAKGIFYGLRSREMTGAREAASMFEFRKWDR